MKIMFASDIHGSFKAAKAIADIYEHKNAERLVLLGDLLYHGPRNPLPEKYDPQAVAQLLNFMKNEIVCVKGNCDSDVDQMLLDFPIMAPYAFIADDNLTMFLTHGHLFSEQNLPPLKSGDIFISGHTHIPVANKKDKHIFLNPGSASLPKEDFNPSYMLYDNKFFTIYDFSGNIIYELAIE